MLDLTRESLEGLMRHVYQGSVFPEDAAEEVKCRIAEEREACAKLADVAGCCAG